MLCVGAVITSFFASCGSSKNKNASENEPDTSASFVQAPAFNADSAYSYVERQVAFGPRVPNTKAHKACGEYLYNQLKAFGATMYDQRADVVSYDGKILKARNIIGAYNPEAKKRVLLCAIPGIFRFPKCRSLYFDA